MPQLENIEAIEKKLWNAADTLRSNSNYASNEYFMPVMGLIFLRHAFSRYLSVKEEIEKSLPQRGGKTRELTKEDFSDKGAIFLREEAQFDYLVSLPKTKDSVQAVISAMESIEQDYTALKGQLPKSEYQELDNEVMGNLLKTLNPEELKKASGDVFGRIYEYFLTQFAGEKAHDGGEFFTPVSLVSLIANVLEPKQGIVLDPACGSGGMFVQSAHFVERMHQDPSKKLTFYGLEKNPTTIRLAKMNLAVHGLEGNIEKAISYYQDPHELLHKADYVMANPPFNVDEIDEEKIKNDPRIPFGLPGVNKEGKVSNGNYIWISYFYSYLTDTGRAGFVMSSQASSAGRDEATVRQKIIETGDVDIMISIRSNFFYTRSVPCELWFFNRAKPSEHKDKVLMIDARNIFRKVTRKIYDFSPEQQNNILAITWLYRGEINRYKDLLKSYLDQTIIEANNCFPEVLTNFEKAIKEFRSVIKTNESIIKGDNKQLITEVDSLIADFQKLVKDFDKSRSNPDPKELATQSHELVKQADLIYRQLNKLLELCGEIISSREATKIRKLADESRKLAIEQLKKVSYFYWNYEWLNERFPEGKLRDVEGLVKLVSQENLKENDWSLTPGRYVGVAPDIEDPDFDFEISMRDIHETLEKLNQESIKLNNTINENYKKLEIA